MLAASRHLESEKRETAGASEVISSSLAQEDMAQRQSAIQKLFLVRRFANSDSEPCMLLDGLYVGSLGAARNLEGLQKRGVTHVLNASPIVPCFHRHHFRYKCVPVYDDVDEDISSFFAETNRFIARGRRRGGVLVHCYAGQSRSVAFIIAYLCASKGMNLAEAYQLVLSVRPCARPNTGFMQQLAEFAEQRQIEAL
ncbi:phosphatases II [Coccomyxa subellipsoidea C-169]|uniref:protein-tyrosine-phosphatase n=1 Tax=Coccomyxa subellipsoidea (strain C-169) TaxID=574566 RepID=I0YZ23_COCSC|nr:phosphatases II [Coccomyxa subellipsoidea C-169]EIE23642.1 phosphatases II [Coccomyxa subellipsoidea C-169]|eukprot:XP_005648186.1 phosphatases II [Coccomyxa subellipsoidea C-169]